jgi:hypothetical protein
MSTLHNLIESTQQPSDQTPDLEPLVDLIRSRYGEAVVAIFLYGSCRDQSNPGDGLVDLCVVIDHYRRAHSNTLSRWANAWLPPNVYFAQCGGLKTKYALISQAGLERKVRARWDHYFWARFSQPITRLYAKTEASARWLVDMQHAALATFHHNTAALNALPKEALAFWAAGLQHTYGCELRPEPASHAVALVDKNTHYWRESFQALQEQPHAQGLARWGIRQRWRARKITGKLMNMARLIKAASTVSQGIDYIAWKVQRHSGIQVEISDWMRQHPRMGGVSLAWRLWRQRGFR